MTFPDPEVGFVILYYIELPELPWEAFRLITRFLRRAS